MALAKSIPILMYHHVSPAPGLVTVSPANFRAQMEWIVRRGWRSIGCDDLAGFLAGKPLPAKAVLITFDDGYLDNYVHAYPVLKELGLSATIFLITGAIGDGPARPCAGDAAPLPPCPDHRACKQALREERGDEVMLRWSEVARMAADGTCQFHSHTHSHRRWDQEIADPSQRQQLLLEDLAQSRQTLQQRLGVDDQHLCWPQGYYDGAYLETATAVGFRYCYTTAKSINRPGHDPLRLGRIVTKDASPRWLERRLRWFADPLVGGLYLRLRGD